MRLMLGIRFGRSCGGYERGIGHGGGFGCRGENGCGGGGRGVREVAFWLVVEKDGVRMNF